MFLLTFVGGPGEGVRDMRREWEIEDLIECWTLDEEELALLANKSGATRLGFGLMLKFFDLEARFPRREDLPRPAVEFMAGQVKVDAALFAAYDWSGRTIEYHRAQIRKFHDFREPTVGDEDKLADWLATKICPVEMSRDRLRGALLARCREDRIEPPKTTRIERVLGAAEAMFERNFTATTVQRLSFESVGKLEELIVAEPAPAGAPVAGQDAPEGDASQGDGQAQVASGGRRAFLQELKEDPGPLQLETLLAEIVKLERVKAIGLPAALFEGVSEKVVGGWRARAMKMYPSDFEAAAPPVRLPLLAALCQVRQAELIDGLVELLIQLVHKISVRAEKKVEGELNAEFRRVQGKNGILVKLATAALELPEEIVRKALYPVVGERTLEDIIAEAKANEKELRTRVRTKLRGSYPHHYRRGLPKLLKAVRFRSSNDTFKPVMDALDLLKRYDGSDADFYAAAEAVPLDTWWPRTGATRSSTPTAAWLSGSRTSCACWSRCARRSGAARSRWRAPTPGATPMRICPPTSRTTVTCTTKPSPSPATQPTSSLTCRSGTWRRWTGWTRA